MRTTDGTTTLPTSSRASRSQGRGGDERGVIALEWLLIVGAVAGLAATSVLTVQQVADDAAEAPVEPAVRFLDAEIAATHIANEATAWRAGLDLHYLDFRFRRDDEYDSFSRRCSDLEPAFEDVVAGVDWRRPLEYDENDNLLSIQVRRLSQEDRDKFYDGEIRAPARCEVTFREGLGG